MGAESRWRVRTGREAAAEVEISEPYWKMDMVERNKPLTDEEVLEAAKYKDFLAQEIRPKERTQKLIN